MGKKRTRASKTSKGTMRTVSKATCQLARSNRPYAVKALNKLNAWLKGKNPWITVPDPINPKNFVKVKANVVYGDPKKARNANIYAGRAAE